MVFHCRCFSIEEDDEIEYNTKTTQTNSTSTQTFHTAPSDLNPPLPNFNVKTSQVSNSPDLRVFTVSELKSATKNFSRSSKIGEGGFGSVFKGVVKSLDYPFHEIPIAVKYAHGLLQGHKEWLTEIDILGVVKHPNLVKLVGYCAEEGELGTQLFLVYEYMPNGSVRDHLSSRSNAPLSWATRLRVAQDAARGLAYLHEDMQFQVILRDFKSSNILLGDQWNAKLSDFGVARLGPADGLTHVSTNFAGTREYAAPEYLAVGHVTSKSDVWSYGVFLYELITGRRPLERNRPQKEQKLLEWVLPHLNRKKFKVIVDPVLEVDKYWLDSAKKLSDIATICLSKDPKSRPKMSEVLGMVSELIGVPVPSQAITQHALPQVPEELNQIALDPTRSKETHDDTQHKGETGSVIKETVCVPRTRHSKLLRFCFK